MEYATLTIVGFSGAHTQIHVCKGCGSLVLWGMTAEHDKFHADFTKTADLAGTLQVIGGLQMTEVKPQDPVRNHAFKPGGHNEAGMDSANLCAHEYNDDSECGRPRYDHVLY